LYLYKKIGGIGLVDTHIRSYQHSLRSLLLVVRLFGNGVLFLKPDTHTYKDLYLKLILSISPYKKNKRLPKYALFIRGTISDVTLDSFLTVTYPVLICP